MRQISGKIELRPLRFAILITDLTADNLALAVASNTSMWGGKLNPILPVTLNDSEPQLDSRSWECFSLRQSVSSFEPDCFISLDFNYEGHFAGKPVISFDDLWKHDYLDEPNKGIGISSVYNYLLAREHRFVSRYQSSAITPYAEEYSKNLFVKILFGGFSDVQPFAETAKSFDRIFQPQKILCRADTLFGISRFSDSPLSIGMTELSQRRPRSPVASFADVIMFLDSDSYEDLVTYWNLRALGWNLRAVPIDWMEQCSNDIEERLVEQHFGAIWTQAVALSVEKFIDHLYLKTTPPVLSTIEKASKGYVGLPTCRGKVQSRELDFDTRLDQEDSFSIQLLPPVFLKYTKFQLGDDWINITTLNPVIGNFPNDFVVPPGESDLSDLMLPKQWRSLSTEPGEILMSAEGILLKGRGLGHKQLLRYPSKNDVWHWWANRQNSVTKSGTTPKSVIFEKLIKTLGRIENIDLLRSRLILKQLDDLAHGQRDYDSTLESPKVAGLTGKRFAYSKAITKDSWLSVLKGAYCNSENALELAEDHFSSLVTMGVLKTGLKIQCEHCNRWSWYLVNRLEDLLECEHCLESSRFPFIDHERRLQWTYRPQGPFSIENFAQGQYSIALTLRFLHRFLRGKFSWLPEAKIDFEGGSTEADLIVWTKQIYGALGYKEAGDLILIEAKSFEKNLDQKDFQKLDLWANNLRGAVIGIATLEEKFSKRTADKLKSKAQEWKKMDISLFVLTATELFSEEGIPNCWLTTFGQTEHNYGTWSIRTLSDITCRLHLGLNS